MDRFYIFFDFDVEGDPPDVYIAEGGECCWIQVLEEPILIASVWSWDNDDWNPGTIASALLIHMNSDDFIEHLGALVDEKIS